MNIFLVIVLALFIAILLLMAYGVGRYHESKKYGIPKTNVYDFYTGKQVK